MAVKELGTGVVVAGGAGGTGYAVYYVMTPKTIRDLLTSEIEDGRGIPIDSLVNESDRDKWWSKAWNRYYLEINSDDDKVLSEVGSTYRNSKKPDDSTDSMKDKFKNECIKLLNKFISEDSDGKIKDKAKKWCVTYETIQEKLGNKVVDESKEKTNWKTKYTTATSTNAPYKGNIETLKEGVNGSSSDDDDKQKSAMEAWCKVALDASVDTIKNLVSASEDSNSYCFLKTPATQ